MGTEQAPLAREDRPAQVPPTKGKPAPANRGDHREFGDIGSGGDLGEPKTHEDRKDPGEIEHQREPGNRGNPGQPQDIENPAGRCGEFTTTTDAGPYRDLFDCAPIGILQSTLDGKLLNANPAMARMLGYDSAADYLSSVKNIAQDLYVDPERRKDLIELVKSCDSLQNFESRFRCKDGREITCNLHVRPARGPSGAIRYMEAFVEDITRQKKIAQALAKSEERYRSVFENTGAGTIIIEKDTTIALANAGFEKLTGYTKAELEGRMKWPAIVAKAEDVKMMKQNHFRRRKSGGQAPIEYEFTLVDKSGNRKSVFLRVDIIVGTNLSVASMIDTTTLTVTRRNLRESESKLTGILAAFEGLVYTCGQDFQIDYMNKALAALVGEKNDRKACHQLIFGLSAPCRWCEKERVFAGETVKYEFENPRDGRWYYAVTSPVYERGDRVAKSQSVIIDIHERKRKEIAMREQDEYLRRENTRLRATIRDRYKFGGIVGKSAPMQEVYELILKAAAADANVILYGESGTGKELAAKAIHDQSDRKEGRFVPVNCGAIPPSLMESQFFGYRKGAFTGAEKNKLGFFDFAAGGTLFLDELGEINEEMQVKLLRVLDGQGFVPIGGLESRRPDVRVIAATNRNMRQLLAEGRIREDFFYRIHIIPINLPPLRRRREDIPLLLEHFMRKHDGAGAAKPLSGSQIEMLLGYDWPGNVRELENTLQRFVNLDSLDFPGATPKGDPRGTAKAPPLTEIPLQEAMERLERRYISQMLRECRWNRSEVARRMGIGRKTLYRRMKHLELQE